MSALFGIPNIGNTCFMASALQFLMSSEELYTKLKENNSYFENFRSNRTHVMKYFVDLYTKYCVKKDYTLGKQDDAMDFIQVIMSRNKSCFNTNKYDQVYFKDKVGSYSNGEELYFLADLASKDIRNFLSDKMLRTDLEFPMLRNYTELSNQIIIQIDRFYKDEEFETVNRDPYNCPEYVFFVENGQQTAYKLISFIHHSGQISSGHYTCYRKVNKKWYYCNDESITLIENPPIEKGYVFMYERVELKELNPPENFPTVEEVRNFVAIEDDITFAENFPNFPFEDLKEDPNITAILSSNKNQLENLYSYLLDGTLFWAETIRMERTIQLSIQCSEFQKSSDLKALIANQLRDEN